MKISLDNFYRLDLKTIFRVPIKNTQLWATYMIINVKKHGRMLLNMGSGETVWPTEILTSKPIECYLVDNCY